MEYLRKLMFDPQAAGEIRFLDLVPRLIRRYEALFDTVMDREMAAARKKTAATSLLTVSSWLGVAAAIVIGLVKASRGALGAGKIVVMLQASWVLSFYLFQMVDWIGVMDMLSSDMGRLRGLLKLAAETGGVDGDVELDGPIDEVELDSVSFEYPGSDRTVLDNVSLSLRRGETMAIVGPNGAGKTTLVKVMLGLYRPREGRVLVNGKDISKYKQGDLRGRMSCVFQDFGKYLLSIRENVGFGDLSKPNDDESLWTALRRRTRPTWSGGLTRDWMPTWASSSGDGSQAESGRRSPLPGVWFATPTSWCWTSRARLWMWRRSTVST